MQSQEEWRKQGQALLAAGSPILAYDTVAQALVVHPGDVRLRQLLALSLARSGAGASALPVLQELRTEGHADEETLGLLARVYKDLAGQALNAADRARELTSAFDIYSEAYRSTGGIWTGINAATTALLLGRRADAAAIATGVRDRCIQGATDDPSMACNYWHIATLAESHLILRDMPAAEAAYTEAGRIGRARPADVASTRRNARLLIAALDIDGAPVELALRVPRVVAFAGHIVDVPGRAVPRFPSAAAPAAGRAIRAKLADLDAGFGFSSGASGADVLFLEEIRERGGETTIVLPYDADQFERDSVDVVPGEDWSARYRKCIAEARDVFLASDQRIAGGEASYEYAVLLIEGLAGVKADELDTELVRLVLWDMKNVGGRGGTAPTIERWRGMGHQVDVIDLAAIVRDAALPVTITPPPPAPAAAKATATEPAAFEPDIVALLFADAKGFSKLHEDQIPAFVDNFLGTVARTLSETGVEPLLKNTWGDGLYFVFQNVRDAAVFALNLQEAIRATQWEQYGLPELSLRTGLHAGPAYACLDPVTQRHNYFGAHVSRAARIEPITPVGQVYASAAFAALARAEGVSEFRCEYVGKTPLAKGYGQLPMFVVRRAAAAQVA